MVRTLWTGIALAGLLAGGAGATQPTALTEAKTRGSVVDWTVLVSYQRAVLTVSTPDGEVVRSEIGPASSPTFGAFDETGEARPDGDYNWELRLDPVLPADVERQLAAALARGDERAARKIRRTHGLDRELVQSGNFVLTGGAFVAGEETEPKPLTPTAKLGPVTAADYVVNDDLIVRGRACVGAACSNGMFFPAGPFVVADKLSTIFFDDTTSPTDTDWAIYTNAGPVVNQGFSVVDYKSGTLPFTISARAPTSSIFVDSVGRVGLGTSTPAQSVHIGGRPFSEFPTIRLDGPTVWDIAGNFAASEFAISDVTSGNAPLTITPGGGLFKGIHIDAAGAVGIETIAPEAKLHVASSGSGSTDGKLLVKNISATITGRELIEGNNNGTALIVLNDAEAAGNRWAFGSAAGGTFLWDNQADPAVEMSLDTAGNLTTTGTVNGVSSREAKTAFAALDPKVTLSRVASLPISTWSYKADGPGVRHAGPMSEDFYQAFQLGQDDKHISFTDSAGIALAAVQGLNQVVQGLNQIVQEKDREIADLKSRLEALERIVLDQRHQPRR